MKVLIVAFHGRPFSGKDLCCRLLARSISADETTWTLGRFAEPLYEMVRTLVPYASSNMPKEDKERPRDELGGLSVRQMLISIGEGVRKYDDNSWTRIWQSSVLADIKQLQRDGVKQLLVLVPDLRKSAELEGLENLTLRIGEGIDLRTVLVHLDSINGDNVEKLDPATETPLPIRAHDLSLLNNQMKGPEDLVTRLHIALGGHLGQWGGQFFAKAVDCGRGYGTIVQRAMATQGA